MDGLLIVAYRRKYTAKVVEISEWASVIGNVESCMTDAWISMT